MSFIAYIDDKEVGRTGNESGLPDFMKRVDLDEADVALASEILGAPMTAGEYTNADGNKYCAALAATFKFGRVTATYVP